MSNDTVHSVTPGSCWRHLEGISHLPASGTSVTFSSLSLKSHLKATLEAELTTRTCSDGKNHPQETQSTFALQVLSIGESPGFAISLPFPCPSVAWPSDTFQTRRKRHQLSVGFMVKMLPGDQRHAPKKERMAKHSEIWILFSKNLCRTILGPDQPLAGWQMVLDTHAIQAHVPPGAQQKLHWAE